MFFYSDNGNLSRGKTYKPGIHVSWIAFSHGSHFLWEPTWTAVLTLYQVWSYCSYCVYMWQEHVGWACIIDLHTSEYNGKLSRNNYIVYCCCFCFSQINLASIYGRANDYIFWHHNFTSWDLCTRQLGFLTDSRVKNVVAKKNAQSVWTSCARENI